MEGVHFFFVKKEVMQKMADGGQLVESAEGPGGALSGTAAATLQQVCSASCKALQGYHVRSKQSSLAAGPHQATHDCICRRQVVLFIAGCLPLKLYSHELLPEQRPAMLLSTQRLSAAQA